MICVSAVPVDLINKFVTVERSSGDIDSSISSSESEQDHEEPSARQSDLRSHLVPEFGQLPAHAAEENVNDFLMSGASRERGLVRRSGSNVSVSSGASVNPGRSPLVGPAVSPLTGEFSPAESVSPAQTQPRTPIPPDYDGRRRTWPTLINN